MKVSDPRYSIKKYHNHYISKNEKTNIMIEKIRNKWNLNISAIDNKSDKKNKREIVTYKEEKLPLTKSKILFRKFPHLQYIPQFTFYDMKDKRKHKIK